MQPKADMSLTSSFRYATFHYVTDDVSETVVPVGVALWSRDANWFRLRLLAEGERISGVALKEALPFIRATEEQMASWAETGRLPYARAEMAPSDDQWWNTVRGLLGFRVRMGEARPIDCASPEAEFDLLYEAVVRPSRTAAERLRRIDHEIVGSLSKETARDFKRGVRVPAFGGAHVEVLRAFSSQSGRVILDGVNLGTVHAERDTDALVSRIERIRHADGTHTTFVLGVVAPPGGLNGSTHLKRWLSLRAGGNVFDLTTEREKFARAADHELRTMKAQQPLLTVPPAGRP